MSEGLPVLRRDNPPWLSPIGQARRPVPTESSRRRPRAYMGFFNNPEKEAFVSKGQSLRDGAVLFVIPAKAGIHLRVRVNRRRLFIPRRCAGPRRKAKGEKMDSGKPSRLGRVRHRNDGGGQFRARRTFSTASPRPGSTSSPGAGARISPHLPSWRAAGLSVWWRSAPPPSRGRGGRIPRGPEEFLLLLPEFPPAALS